MVQFSLTYMLNPQMVIINHLILAKRRIQYPVAKLCSSHNDFNAHISSLKHWLLARDYSEQIDKVVFGKQPALKDTSEQTVPFVTTYYPRLKDFGKMIKNLQLFLYSDSEVQRVFSPAFIASYRSTGKIRDCIVKSKLYPIERKVGRPRCGMFKYISN